jgi:Inovirus Coat protein B
MVIDVTDVVAGMALAAAPIGLIGGAKLLVKVGIRTWQWVSRAL